MSKRDFSMTAGQIVEFYEPSDFFRLLSANNPVKIEYYRNGAEISEADGVTTGYAEKFNDSGFDRVRITSATAQTVSFITRMGSEVFFDAPPTGDVKITGKTGPISQYTRTVGMVSIPIINALVPNRYIFIQNKSASGSIYLSFTGNDATVADGFRLGPGESMEFSDFIPVTGVNAIGDIPSNSEVIVMWG